MFQSSEMAYLNPSNCNNKSYSLGIGKGFLLILILCSPKSDMKQTVSLFVGMIKGRSFPLRVFYVLIHLY